MINENNTIKVYFAKADFCIANSNVMYLYSILGLLMYLLVCGHNIIMAIIAKSIFLKQNF